MKKILKRFKSLGLVGIAFGITVGGSIGELLNSMVDHILMPLVGYLIAEDAWDKDALVIGEISLKWGQVMADAVHFLIIAIVLYFVIEILEERREEDRE
jgi:large conductance mechanosensitive channel